jgi:hypothetical protein
MIIYYIKIINKLSEFSNKSFIVIKKNDLKSLRNYNAIKD